MVTTTTASWQQSTINNPIPETADPATADPATAEPATVEPATATVDIHTFLESIKNDSELVERTPEEKASMNSKGVTPGDYDRANKLIKSFIDGLAAIRESCQSFYLCNSHY